MMHISSVKSLNPMSSSDDSDDELFEDDHLNEVDDDGQIGNNVAQVEPQELQEEPQEDEGSNGIDRRSLLYLRQIEVLRLKKRKLELDVQNEELKVNIMQLKRRKLQLQILELEHKEEERKRMEENNNNDQNEENKA